MSVQSKPAAVADKAEITRLIAAARVDGEADAYAGKRGCIRIAEGMQLEVSTDPQTHSATWPVSMHDISLGGVAFWSKQDVPLGTVMYVREFSADNSRSWLPARVKHRTTGIRGYLIGARFETSDTSGPRNAAPSVPDRPAAPPQILPPGLRGPRR